MTQPFTDLDHLPASTTPKEDKYHATIAAQAETIAAQAATIRTLREALERIAEKGEAGSMAYTLAEIARAVLERTAAK